MAARQFTSLSLPEEVSLMLSERLSVPAETFSEAGWSYTPNYPNRGRRVVIPIRDPSGRRRGSVFRSYWGDTPKAFNILSESSSPSLAWCRATRFGKTCVLVEDIPSAHRLMCSGIDAVALLGTLIDHDRASEISRAGFTKAIICLDNDATNQALLQALSLPRFSRLFNVKVLDGVDIKDMDATTYSTFTKELQSMMN